MVVGRLTPAGEFGRKRHLQRVFIGGSRRRERAADDFHDGFDLRGLMVSRRCADTFHRGQGGQRDRSSVRAGAVGRNSRADTGRRGQGAVSRLVGRPAALLRAHQRTRPQRLRPVSLRGEGLRTHTRRPERRSLRDLRGLPRWTLCRTRQAAHQRRFGHLPAGHGCEGTVARTHHPAYRQRFARRL